METRITYSLRLSRTLQTPLSRISITRNDNQWECLAILRDDYSRADLLVVRRRSSLVILPSLRILFWRGILSYRCMEYTQQPHEAVEVEALPVAEAEAEEEGVLRLLRPLQLHGGELEPEVRFEDQGVKAAHNQGVWSYGGFLEGRDAPFV